MSVVIVTGSAGLIGAETVRFFSRKNLTVIGIDNDMRRYYFGNSASTAWSRESLKQNVQGYIHADIDIRDYGALESIFKRYHRNIVAIVHTAAQPSHDWAAREPMTDFAVNATGTLNLLELTRLHCPEAVFLFTSTNKVYGDTPNRLPLVEQDKRWELTHTHPFSTYGIDESMSIDQSLHSLFGASKLGADVLVQEYGRYFDMKTACFRAGCLTGPGHSGAQLHGFLAYLVRCAITGQAYTVFGYQGKQVRDNLHSYDLVRAFWQFFQKPRVAEVYNMGGGLLANCSMLEAIDLCEWVIGRPLRWSYSESNRAGDHIWWISDIRKFQLHYPDWRPTYDIEQIITEIRDGLMDHFASKKSVEAHSMTVTR